MAFKKLSVSHHHTWWSQIILLDTWYTVPHWKVFIVSSVSSFEYNPASSFQSFSPMKAYIVNQHDIKKWILVKPDRDNLFTYKWFIFTAWERVAFRFECSYSSNNLMLCWTICWEEITDV